MPRVLEASKIGPVDVAMITFDGTDFSSEVAPALADLQASGTVKIIDLAFLRRDEDGSTAIVEITDESVAEVFYQVVDSRYDLLSEDDLADLARSLDPSSAAMVVVWENSWAARFASAVRDSRGRITLLERVPQENVERAITALGE